MQLVLRVQHQDEGNEMKCQTPRTHRSGRQTCGIATLPKKLTHVAQHHPLQPLATVSVVTDRD